MKNNDYPRYFKNEANDGVLWFWYGNMECC